MTPRHADFAKEEGGAQGRHDSWSEVNPATAFAYGTRYLERPDSFELDPASLSLTDRSAVRGQTR